MNPISLVCLFIVAGTAFSQTQEQLSSERQTAISNLEPYLLHANDKSTTVLALNILRDLKSKESVRLAIPLLKHVDPGIQAAAARLIAIDPPRESLPVLSEALDSCNGSNIEMESELGRCFVSLEDPASLPAIRRAVKKGIFGYVAIALGRLGERDDFELLLEAVQQHDSMDALEGLMPMVYRSNKPFEVWMSENNHSPKSGLAHKQEWQAWWDKNKGDFIIEKTAKEAFKQK